jgi:hypothetical protein
MANRASWLRIAGECTLLGLEIRRWARTRFYRAGYNGSGSSSLTLSKRGKATVCRDPLGSITIICFAWV